MTRSSGFLLSSLASSQSPFLYYPPPLSDFLKCAHTICNSVDNKKIFFNKKSNKKKQINKYVRKCAHTSGLGLGPSSHLILFFVPRRYLLVPWLLLPDFCIYLDRSSS